MELGGERPSEHTLELQIKAIGNVVPDAVQSIIMNKNIIQEQYNTLVMKTGNEKLYRSACSSTIIARNVITK